MPKARSQFVCQECGHNSGKWYGRCPNCQAWDSLIEEAAAPEDARRSQHSAASATDPRPLSSIRTDGSHRIRLPLPELDRLLGGGLMRGSVVLLAGDPGIGKSTLLLQLLGHLAAESSRRTLYVSGEESANQLKQRANRLGISQDSLLVLTETNVDAVVASLEKAKPEVAVIDSVQALYWPELTSVPGSVSQVREVADRLVRMAKQNEISLILVGHVNKEGGIAGPMALEHLVDTVLFFEGEQFHSHRILRATKNRFGSTNEIAVFEMREDGLREVTNPSEFFLKDRQEESPGTVVYPAMEGSRPLLVEVQGLTSPGAYGVPMRTAVGFDRNRLTMITAVLEKRAGVRLSDQDIYINIVGGLRISETGVDLAVAAAILSSFTGKVLPAKCVALGEIGLTGEVRSVPQMETRLREAEKLGFEFALVPKTELKAPKRLECRVVRTVQELLRLVR